MQHVPVPTISPEMSYSDIIVPTMDFVRGAYLIEKLLKNTKKVIFESFIFRLRSVFFHRVSEKKYTRLVGPSDENLAISNGQLIWKCSSIINWNVSNFP